MPLRFFICSKVLSSLLLLLLFSSTFLLSLSANAQESTPSFVLKAEPPTVLAPSPNAASLGKFVDVPVSLYTGTPEISIPLYQITGRGINVPISLSYHAGGLKVDEISSWVGAGWTLNAGGVLSRTVRGIRDEHPSVGYFVRNPFKANGAPDVPECTTESSDGGNAARVVYEQLNRLADGCYDTEPDMFFYNVPGSSGKFVFDQQVNPYFLPHQPVKLQHLFNVGAASGNTKTEWALTGADGTRYSFGPGEISDVQQGCANGALGPCMRFEDVPSSWYLYQLVSPTGRDTVWFEYENETTRYLTSGSSTEYKLISGFNGTMEQGGKVICKDQVTVSGKRLMRIRSSMGHRVEFLADFTTTRQDLEWGSRLQAVEIYFQNTLLKRFTLHHSYFSATTPLDGEHRDRPDVTDTFSNFSLRLDSLQEFGTGGIAVPPYAFFYDGNYRPSRHSQAKDHWGYYNNNVDRVLFPGWLSYKNGLRYLYKPEPRTARIRYAQAGTLRKVQYPTGGNAHYTYESHDQADTRVIKQADSLFFQTEAQGLTQWTFQLNQQRTIRAWSYTKQNTLGSPYCYLKIFNSAGQMVQNLSRNWSGQTFVLPPGTYTVKARMLDYNCSIFDCAAAELEHTTLEEQEFVYPDSDTFAGEGINLKLWWEKDETAQTVAFNRPGGGLRIAETVLADGLFSERNIAKAYRYTQNETTAVSSGRRRSALQYRYLLYQNTGTPPTFSIGSPYLTCENSNMVLYEVTSSTSHAPLMTMQGSYVGYNEVSVWHGLLPNAITLPTEGSEDDPIPGGEPIGSILAPIYTRYGANGYNRYRYHNADSIPYEIPASVGVYPFVPQRDNLWHGMLKEQTDFRRTSSGAYEPVNMVRNSYAYGAFVNQNAGGSTQPMLAKDIWGYKVGRLVQTACMLCDYQNSNEWSKAFQTNTYFDRSEWLKLTSTITRSYDTNDTTHYTQLVTSHQYGSYNPEPLVTLTDDGSNQTETRFYFPMNALHVTPVITKMRERNMLGTLLEKQVSLQQAPAVFSSTYSAMPLVSGIRNSYRVSNGLVLQDKVGMLEPNASGTSAYVDRLFYDTYDALGNLLSYHAEGGAAKSYLWGYRNYYPIAEAVNAASHEIAYTSFEAVGDGGWEMPAAAARTVTTILNGASTSFSVAMPQYVQFSHTIQTAASGIPATFPKVEVVRNGTVVYTWQVQGPGAQEKPTYYLEPGLYELRFSCADPYYLTTSQVRAAYTHTAYLANSDAKTGAASATCVLTKSGLNATKHHIVSLWAKGDGGVTVNGVSQAAGEEWTYLEWLVAPAAQVTVTPDALVAMDEVRLHPQGAQMTSHTYIPGVGVTTVSDPNGRISYYTYDGLGRLQTIKDEQGNILKTYEYVYRQ